MSQEKEIKDCNLVDQNTEVVGEEKKEERGASMVEYALLVALIAVVCIAMVRALGQSINTTFSNINSAVSSN